MSEPKKPVGSIAWVDLTIPEADRVRDFYGAVVGWSATGLDMGGYSDYVMSTPDGEAAAGVCHARGGNADLPPVWMLYVIVADLDQSIARCEELGGSVIAGPKKMGETARYCIIRDPAGAAIGLYQY